MTLFDDVDPRLQAALREEFLRRASERLEGIPRGTTVVLVGHRAAGKSTLLPRVAALLGRGGVDLDRHLEARAGRSLREWVERDERSFRAAEREAYRALPRGGVVAVGGGFLAHHAEVLRGCLVVEVPVTFETYVERLSADTTRPRLRPELPLAEELREVYEERERRHRAARPLSLVDFALRLGRPLRARRVVTLPPGASVERFAWEARHAGAELLEVRSDLHPPETDLLPASRALPLLVAQRTREVAEPWLRLARMVDWELEAGAREGFVSFHARHPLTPDEALGAWRDVPRGAVVKHVEPLGDVATAARLFETQRRLQERFGAEAVTVLATGPLALPFRALLAGQNMLDYLALDATWAAAPGQRLLADAVREARADTTGRARLGILGHGLAHSRSPRLHPQPFDRVDVPADVALEPLLAALRPYYRGFAVTAPFKRAAARAVRDERPAVNTLIRTARGWRADNSDVDGAHAVLEALGADRVTVLGDGGVTDALREAAAARGVALRVVRQAEVPATPLEGAVVWTWPTTLDAPAALRFAGARVAVVAYGPPARRIVEAIAARGGVPLRLGPRWFIAQARRQRTSWESAE